MIDDGRLENEELRRDHHEAGQRDEDLPHSRFARRTETVKRREQQRVECGEDGERAWASEKRSCRIDEGSNWGHDLVVPLHVSLVINRSLCTDASRLRETPA